ncbi:hypothetical protein EVAR_44715_1 [Eumeta japonica]|uniref:Uncharacterized protein n=1 Tax=Eumeta variegata TaxID=151549 RepID=A0A4C1XID7_EUMVA|nr:hypothetical protein EVAR_44715_1 [Eumeta japonica]
MSALTASDVVRIRCSTSATTLRIAKRFELRYALSIRHKFALLRIALPDILRVTPSCVSRFRELVFVPPEPSVRARTQNVRSLFHSIGRCVRVEERQRPHTTYT